MESRFFPLVVLLCVAVLTDIRQRKIPNTLVLVGMSLGLLFAARSGEEGALIASLLGAACGLALYLPFYALGWMGAGDVKLLAMVGTFSAPLGVFLVSLYSAVIGGAIAIATVCIRERSVPSLSTVTGIVMSSARMASGGRKAGLTSTLPYATAIAAGSFIWMYGVQAGS